ncbi:hypothetical protein MGH68_15440 [Erysipelothrix sp. D19-032]
MKKLNQDNEAELRAFLAVEPHYNLFLIGDLDAFGFDDTIQTYYGDYKDGELVGVIFRFRDDSIHIYATEIQESLIVMIDKLFKDLPFKRIMVTKPTMDLLGDHILPYIQKPRPTTMSVYTPNDFDVDTHSVQRLDATFAKHKLRISKHWHLRVKKVVMSIVFEPALNPVNELSTGLWKMAML